MLQVQAQRKERHPYHYAYGDTKYRPPQEAPATLAKGKDCVEEQEEPADQGLALWCRYCGAMNAIMCHETGGKVMSKILLRGSVQVLTGFTSYLFVTMLFATSRPLLRPLLLRTYNAQTTRAEC